MSLDENAHKVLSFLRKHSAAILLAAAIGVATGAPQFYVIYQMGSAYQGIFPISSDDDRYYEARAQEARDGFPMLGNPYIFELRDAPGVSFWIPDAALSYAGEFLGLDVQHSFALFDFILPPLLFLVTYAILLFSTRSKLTALLGGAVFHLGLFLDTFTRSPSPQFNFLFVELALLFALLVAQRRRYAYIPLACTLGALFYVYPYFWTFVYGAIGMFFLLTLILKKLRPLSLPLFGALAAGALIGLPVLVQMFAAEQSAAYRETILRLGMIFSHTPAGFSSILLCGTALLAYAASFSLISKLREDAEAWFFASIVLGGVLSANNQILTGRNLEFSSHYFLPCAYAAFIAAIYLGASLYERVLTQKLAKYARLGAIVFAVLAAAIGGALSDLRRTHLQDYQLQEQRYAAVLEWLNENTKAESVIMANDNTSYFIAAYTKDRIFYSRNANLHIMTTEEAWTRFLLMYRDSDLTNDFFNGHVGEIFGAHYFDEYGHTIQLNKIRKLLGLPQRSAELIPSSAKKDFKDFAAELTKKPAKEVLEDRKIDYIVSESGFQVPPWARKAFPRMHEVYTVSGFTIYSLK